MPDLTHRLERAPELLDAPSHDRAELARSLAQVAEVNRLLGGTRAVLLALREICGAAPRLRLLDVGTGSADIPIAVVRRARARNIDVHVTATDIHPQVLDIAAERVAERGLTASITVQTADALELPFADASFDVVLLSLALHHFDGEDQLRVLRQAGRTARRAVVVNELERCRANWYGARLLAATRWRSNRLTRHDGPLSVRRAFTRTELHQLAREAGLEVESVRRRFFYRLVLIADIRSVSSATRTEAK